MDALLLNKKINTAEFDNLPRSWYASREYLYGFKSVKEVIYTDTTSSAGDWSGYFIQKRGNKFYLIQFNQINNYPRSGYTLYTDQIPLVTFDKEMTTEEIYNILAEENWF